MSIIGKFDPSVSVQPTSSSSSPSKKSAYSELPLPSTSLNEGATLEGKNIEILKNEKEKDLHEIRTFLVNNLGESYADTKLSLSALNSDKDFFEAANLLMLQHGETLFKENILKTLEPVTLDDLNQLSSRIQDEKFDFLRDYITLRNALETTSDKPQELTLHFQELAKTCPRTALEMSEKADASHRTNLYLFLMQQNKTELLVAYASFSLWARNNPDLAKGLQIVFLAPKEDSNTFIAEKGFDAIFAALNGNLEQAKEIIRSSFSHSTAKMMMQILTSTEKWELAIALTLELRKTNPDYGHSLEEAQHALNQRYELYYNAAIQLLNGDDSLGKIIPYINDGSPDRHTLRAFGSYVERNKEWYTKEHILSLLDKIYPPEVKEYFINTALQKFDK